MADFKESEQFVNDETLATIKKKVEELKKDNPKIKKIYPIAVMGSEEDDKDMYVGYFRQPAFIVFSKYMSIVQNDSIGAMKELAKDCFLGGDDELLKDDSLFLFGLMPQLTALIEVRKGQLINLSKAGK